MSPPLAPRQGVAAQPAAAGGRHSQFGHLTHHDAAGVWLNAQADNQGLTTFFPAHLILRIEMDPPNPTKAKTDETRKHTLTRSGIVVTIPEDWTVADTQASQRYGKGDAPKTNTALIQRVCLFNGEKWTIAQIQDPENIGGKDYMELMGELYSDGDDEDADGEGDEAGNA